jgi:hypothetical protein
MAPVLNATLAGPESNSYVTLADADTIAGNMPFYAEWDATSDEDKTIALIVSTNWLETLDYVGDRCAGHPKPEVAPAKRQLRRSSSLVRCDPIQDPPNGSHAGHGLHQQPKQLSRHWRRRQRRSNWNVRQAPETGRPRNRVRRIQQPRVQQLRQLWRPNHHPSIFMASRPVGLLGRRHRCWRQ